MAAPAASSATSTARGLQGRGHSPTGARERRGSRASVSPPIGHIDTRANNSSPSTTRSFSSNIVYSPLPDPIARRCRLAQAVTWRPQQRRTTRPRTRRRRQDCRKPTRRQITVERLRAIFRARPRQRLHATARSGAGDRPVQAAKPARRRGASPESVHRCWTVRLLATSAPLRHLNVVTNSRATPLRCVPTGIHGTRRRSSRCRTARAPVRKPATHREVRCRRGAAISTVRAGRTSRSGLAPNTASPRRPRTACRSEALAQPRTLQHDPVDAELGRGVHIGQPKLCSSAVRKRRRGPAGTSSTRRVGPPFAQIDDARRAGGAGARATRCRLQRPRRHCACSAPSASSNKRRFRQVRNSGTHPRWSRRTEAIRCETQMRAPNR